MTDQPTERASWEPVATQMKALTNTVLWADLPAEDIQHVADTLAEVNRYLDERAGPEPALATTFTSGRPVRDQVAHNFRRRSLVSSPEHPFSPPLNFEVDDEGNATGHVRLSRAFQGPPGRCHGGYVAVLLDHIFGATGAWTMPGPFFTKALEVVYDAGVPLLVDLVVTSRVDRIEGRKAFVTGEITADGQVCARGNAVLVMPKEFVS
ncbi:PaaI family thioesterase [Enemella sp. A6]|uniref:PaaI family thioesterase n=1 Tax=Enemella sp. A6 TaxID=3440152 RepID=UPI003EBEC604